MMAQCSAKSKRSGQQCQKAAMHGRRVCYHHGGKSLVGAASGTYRHGKYSKVLPTRLAARYAESLANPALLSLKDDLAVCESRLADLLQRVDTGASGALWQALTQASAAFRTAMAAGDIPAMRDHVVAMHDLIQHGSADHATWQEIQRLWETRCRLTQAEVKLLMTQQQMVTTEQLMVYFGMITETIRQAVLTHADAATGRAILGDISAGFQHLSTLPEA
jgi:hypothetical protein